MFKKYLKSILITALITIGLVFGLQGIALALDVGVNEVQSTIALPSTDIRVIIARIINALLGLLGVVVLIIIIYGGFKWMTAGGDETAITKAKKIIINGAIGLLIALSSFAISQFVLSRLIEATGGGNFTNEITNTDIIPGGSGCPRDAFCVTGISPKNPPPVPAGFPKNSIVYVRMNKPIDETTINLDNVVISKRDGASWIPLGTDSGSIHINSGDNKEIVFEPSHECAPFPGTNCFEADSDYKVQVTTNLKSAGDRRDANCSGFAATCQSEFRIGNTIDSSSPESQLIRPWNGKSVSIASIEQLEARVTDDSGISRVGFIDGESVLGYINPSGSPTSFNPIYDWDTNGLGLQSCHDLRAEARDVGSNFGSSAEARVVIRPAHCFDRIRNSSETGIDCGGTGDDYCGKCSGETCVESPTLCRDFCRSSACVSGVCVDLPIITSVSPMSGVSGRYVTISGEFFGTTPGVVKFLGGSDASDDKTALLAPCGSGTWTNNQIVVVVPEGFVAGPIEVSTSSGTDTTVDARGPNLGNFTVGNPGPSVCSVSPAGGGSGDPFLLSGTGFGDTQGGSVANFSYGSLVRPSVVNSWSSTSISGVVPSDINTGRLQIRALVGVVVTGVTSNSVAFYVNPLDYPVITSITPNSGPERKTITLRGSNFGTSVGNVVFTDSAGTDRNATTDFPVGCSNFWRDDQIIVKVPVGISAGTVSVKVRRSDGRLSETKPFTINTDPLGPSICGAIPESGPVSTSVNFYGERLGTLATSKARFSTDRIANPESVGEFNFNTRVPSSALSGPVQIEVGTVSATNPASNPWNFRVEDCRGASGSCGAGSSCCGDGTCRASCPTAPTYGDYSWFISTGPIPQVPRLIFECASPRTSTSPDPSPAPYRDRTGGSNVCVNAAIAGRFTTSLNRSTLVKGLSLKLFTCGSGAEPTSTCSEVLISDYELDFNQWGAENNDEFKLYPPAGQTLAINTWYQVKLGSTILGDETSGGQPLQSSGQCGAGFAQCWYFKTKADATPCELGYLNVEPSSKIATAIGPVEPLPTYTASTISASDACILVTPNYDFVWDSSDTLRATVARESAPRTHKATANAIRETLVRNPVDISATVTEGAQRVSDDAELTIDFTDPVVASYEPNCNEACINAAVMITFNTEMCSGDRSEPCTSSVTSRDAVTIKKCTNESCVDFSPVADLVTSRSLSADKKVVVMGHANFEPNSYYRVVLSGNVQSTSGVSLTGRNYGPDFSWIFKTKNDATPCVISSVDLNPTEVTVRVIGARVPYRAIPRGAPDACSASGQILSDSYDWGWSPVSGNEAAIINPNSTSSDFTRGCSRDACLNTGSGGRVAICGNGIIEAVLGEECDGSDGCSTTTCLHTGSVSDRSTCGDRIIGEGEDCDDGNTVSDDGCSASCLNEGSLGGVSVCGNDSVGVGEDCDDGNISSGDGCSSRCLREGSARGPISICGNGGSPEEGEDCDDGNTVSSDGCSSSCLNEGRLACLPPLPSSASNCCGNGRRETGEDCDDGNVNNNDGCSSGCLSEGSSYLYHTASYCGDTMIGIGEECEARAGTATVSSHQVAEAVGRGAVTDGRQRTVIEAEAQTKVGSSNFYLQCGFNNDSECLLPETYEVCGGSGGCGVGTDSCCYKRPTVETVIPVDRDTDVCRNPLIYAEFDKPMDEDSFTGNMQIARWVSSAAECSGGEVVAFNSSNGEENNKLNISFDNNSRGLIGLWQGIKKVLAKFILGASAAPPTPGGSGVWCVGGASGVSGTVSGVTEGTGSSEKSKIFFQITGSALAPNSWYLVRVKGDSNLTDGQKEGVLSVDGVSMSGNGGDGYYDWIFETGANVCDADLISVSDDGLTDDEVSLFTNSEPRMFRGEVLNRRGALLQPIVPIEGVYSWLWESWTSSKENILKTPIESDNFPGISKAQIIPQNNNGDTLAGAHIKINIDTLNAPSTVNNVVSGYRQVEVFLCENPWPGETDPDSGRFPLEDSYGHFTTSYCRDAGQDGFADDLSTLTLQHVSTPPTGILREFFLSVDGPSTDVIGFRIKENENSYSAERWYASQNFRGSPESIEVDGYGAVRDGRTIYVNAANLGPGSDGLIHSQIYIISYNEGASAETLSIYDQLIENLRFNSNLSFESNSNLCAGEIKACSSDFDCSAFDACNSGKNKMQRDIKRLEDLRDMEVALSNYRARVGHYPTLESGTFVRTRSNSLWSSWLENLSRELNVGLPPDPINRLICPSDYDSETCFNQTLGVFRCDAGSRSYTYTSVNPTNYRLETNLEGTGGWYIRGSGGVLPSLPNLISVPSGSTAEIKAYLGVGGTCTSGVIGNSGTCGDGIVGTGEVCEIGQTSSVACNPSSPAGAPIDSGRISAECNISCTGFTPRTGAACVASYCGDGVVQNPNASGATEVCDDGANNGRYGFCAADCGVGRTGAATFGPYCGDGLIAGAEACDKGALNNGQWTNNSVDSCAMDCTFPGLYCGDGIVNGPEECDINSSTKRSICSGGTRICDTTADCPAGQTCSTTEGAGGRCPTTLRCSSNVNDGTACVGRLVGSSCSTAIGSGICTTYEQFRTQNCNSSCGWIATGLSCAPRGFCGNGIREGTEECDDGNTSSNDACTTSCRYNVCGDGFPYTGVEACDAGVRTSGGPIFGGGKNGDPCNAPYGGICNYCSAVCSLVTQTGAFCGDSRFSEGYERCDYSATPVLIQRCSNAPYSPCSTSTDCGVGNQCLPVGYSADRSICDSSCRSICPPDLSTSTLHFDDTPSPSTSFHFANNDVKTISIPSCRMGDGFAVDVDIGSEVLNLPSPIGVLFVLDNSGSMVSNRDVECDSRHAGLETRLDCLKSAMNISIDRLFGSRPAGEVKMGIVDFGSNSRYRSWGGGLHTTGICSDSGIPCYNASDYPGDVSRADGSGLLSDNGTNRVALRAIINTLDASGASTQTHLALKQARTILENASGLNSKVIILMSDGEPTASARVFADTEADAINSPGGIILFTVSYPTRVASMDSWAERVPSGTESPFARDGRDIGIMFDQIISALTGVVVQISNTDSFDAGATDSTTLREGYNIPIEIDHTRSEDLYCSGSVSNNAYIKVNFIPIGTSDNAKVVLSNLNWSYCPLPSRSAPIMRTP